MELLIISGTPKTSGLTCSFVLAAEEAARAEGVEFETIRLAALGLKKCRMCGDGWGICASRHVCTHGGEDSFNAVQQKVDEARAFVFVSPVYWGEPSEDFKIFLDKLRRCQASKRWSGGEASFMQGKPSVLVAVAGGSGAGALSALAAIERALEQMGGNEHPRETAGVYDCIAANRWNQEQKRDAFVRSLKGMFSASGLKAAGGGPADG